MKYRKIKTYCLCKKKEYWISTICGHIPGKTKCNFDKWQCLICKKNLDINLGLFFILIIVIKIKCESINLFFLFVYNINC